RGRGFWNSVQRRERRHRRAQLRARQPAVDFSDAAGNHRGDLALLRHAHPQGRLRSGNAQPRGRAAAGRARDADAEPLIFSIVTALPPPEQIRETTRAILARGEFAEPSRWHEMILEFLQAIKQWLDRLGSWTEAHPDLADVLPFGRRRKASARAPGARWDILEGSAADWREALELARARLGEGNLRRAIWIAHRVLLGLLDEQGAIKFAGWKTNSHYLAECAREHPWRATFAELTELYEGAVYADRGAAPEAAAALLARLEDFCRDTGAAA